MSVFYIQFCLLISGYAETSSGFLSKVQLKKKCHCKTWAVGALRCVCPTVSWATNLLYFTDTCLWMSLTPYTKRVYLCVSSVSCQGAAQLHLYFSNPLSLHVSVSMSPSICSIICVSLIRSSFLLSSLPSNTSPAAFPATSVLHRCINTWETYSVSQQFRFSFCISVNEYTTLVDSYFRNRTSHNLPSFFYKDKTKRKLSRTVKCSNWNINIIWTSCSLHHPASVCQSVISQSW